MISDRRHSSPNVLIPKKMERKLRAARLSGGPRSMGRGVGVVGVGRVRVQVTRRTS